MYVRYVVGPLPEARLTMNPVAYIGLALIAILLPMSVHELLDTWGDRHTDVRRAVMVAAGSMPVLAAVALLAS